MEKKKKIGILILLLALVYVCRSLPAEEKDMDWLWYEVGFWPVLETEVEMTPMELEVYNLKIEEFEPFQFTLAEMETCALRYGKKQYVLSPEAGLLFEDGLGDDYIIKLTDSKGRYNGLYACGVIQQGQYLYYAEAEEKNHIWLPGLLTEGQLRITRYEMDYSRCDLETGETEPISEEDYMDIKAATQEK